MAKVRARELQEQLLNIPDAVPLDVATLKNDTADLFVCALGFEPRCLSIPTLLSESGFTADRAIYFEYESNAEENEASRSALLSKLARMSSKVEALDCDAPDFLQRLKSFFENLCQKRQPRVIVDNSVFGNRLAFKLYSVLFSIDVQLDVLYSEAAIYHPTKVEYESDPASWGHLKGGLEHGVSSIAVSPEHPGEFLDLQPDYACILAAFGPERSRAALEWIDTSLLDPGSERVQWFVGVPHLPEDAWRVVATKAHHEIGDNDYHVEVSTFDYKATVTALHNEFLQRSERFNLTLVPLGSKLQALGAALCCFMHPEIRVLFAVPRQYNTSTYTEGVKAFWHIQFGSTAKLTNALLDVDSLYIDYSS